MDMSQVTALRSHREVWFELLPADAQQYFDAGVQFSLVRDLYPVRLHGNPNADIALMVQIGLMKVLGEAVVRADAHKSLGGMLHEAAIEVGCPPFALPGGAGPVNAEWSEPWSYLSQLDMMYMLRGLSPTEHFADLEDDDPEVQYISLVQRLHHHLAGWLLCTQEHVITSDAGRDMALWGQAWLTLLDKLARMPVAV